MQASSELRPCRAAAGMCVALHECLPVGWTNCSEVVGDTAEHAHLAVARGYRILEVRFGKLNKAAQAAPRSTHASAGRPQGGGRTASANLDALHPACID